MVSPVLFISALSRGSSWGNRRNGKTGALTAHQAIFLDVTFSRFIWSIWIMAAILAKGRPMALLTYGMVREARGLTSITTTRSFLTAIWMLQNPLTERALTIFSE